MKPIRQFLGPVLLIVVLAIVFLFHACALTDADSEETSHTEQEFTFSSGITIGGVNVEGMTEDEAKEWVEKYLTVDEYIKIFGECEE